MKNYRPDGWDSGKMVSEVLTSADSTSGMAASQRLVEAGADAILKALRETGYPIRAGESFGDEETGARTIVKVGGQVVFIPDES